MRVGSLFAGIGGFDLAATRVWGPEAVRWQCEIDPWCRRVLTKHWPDVPKYGDIRELTGDELEPVGLICGGFPCQPWSLNGAQRGVEDTRHLWPEMARVVSLVKPRWVVGENVPGILGTGLDPVCADLEGLGYEVWTLGIPAVAVGAPHIRERLWIVAHAEGESFGSGLRPGEPRGERRGRSGDSGGSHAVSDPLCPGLEVREGPKRKWAYPATSGSCGWAVEPGVGRVANGIPHRVDRLRGLGNAIVPQVAELIFRWIAEAEEQA